MVKQNAQARRLLACLGHRSRFRIVTVLLAQECCVTELADQIGLSQSCTTRHLQALKREGIVRGSRVGKRVLFRVAADEPRIRSLLSWALEDSSVAEAPGGASLHREAPESRPSRRNGRRSERIPTAEPVVETRPRSARGQIEDFLL